MRFKYDMITNRPQIMFIDQVFSRFGDLLDLRLAKRIPTTEDATRYTFFAAVLGVEGLGPENIELESSHPQIPRAEIDTVINSSSGGKNAVEFKYDRPLPGGKNTPRTQRAGNAFNDMRRLSLIGADTKYVARLFVYVATKEMFAYFNNQTNGLSDVFNMQVNDVIFLDSAFFTGKAQSFNAACGDKFVAKLKAKYKRTLPYEHQLRIYDISPK